MKAVGIISVLILGHFQAVWSQCLPENAEIVTERYGTISSPNYPQNYPDNSACTWIIDYNVTGTTDTVDIRFIDFELEPSTGCRFDRMIVRDGPLDTSPIVGIYCGSALPPGTITTGPYLRIEFTSDGSSNYRGFRIAYETSEKACSEGLREISTGPGAFQSPHHPWLNYRSNSLCHWRITGPVDKIIILYLPLLNTKQAVLELFDGGSDTDPMLGRFFGAVREISTFSTGNVMLVRFSSSDAGDTGFRAEYDFVDAPFTTPAPTGTPEPEISTTPAPPLPIPPTNTPVFELNINGTFRTVDSSDINAACMDGYRDGLRSSGSYQLVNLNVLLGDLTVCSSVSDISVSSFALSASTLGINGFPTYSFRIPAPKQHTFDTVVGCANELATHMENHDNWPNPIISTPILCPGVVWEPTAFTKSPNSRWLCLDDI